MRNILKYTFLAINLLLVICLGLGMLCTKISPEKSAFLPYFGLLFPFFALLNFFFFLFWIYFKKWFCLISLCMLLFAVPYIKDIFPLSISTPHISEKDKKISILSYNIAMFGEARNFDAIFSFIKEKNPDIVCLQEFGFYKSSKDLDRNVVFKKFSKMYPYKHVWYKNQFKSKDYGVVTFSKYPIINKQKILYDSKYNISIYSDIVVDSDTIRIFNNHLESVKFTVKEKSEVNHLNSEEFLTQETFQLTESLLRKLGSAFKIRAKQADAVALEIKRSPYKTIVCGDFNDMPISYTYKKIKGNMNDLFVSTAFGFDYTYHDMAMFLRIDHIFISSAFLPIQCEIFHTNYSDHDPIFGEFLLK